MYKGIVVIKNANELERDVAEVKKKYEINVIKRDAAIDSVVYDPEKTDYLVVYVDDLEKAKKLDYEKRTYIVPTLKEIKFSNPDIVRAVMYSEKYHYKFTVNPSIHYTYVYTLIIRK
ncbi:MAG: hypothetical protein NDF55_10595 [archaeon GB-1867-005]|nr:hypothetical protein [Candidatus Culexmicrobium cathedralense]